ncbi:hypothetical protein PG984_011824 [Apiospora sp. TS-2023a]
MLSITDSDDTDSPSSVSLDVALQTVVNNTAIRLLRGYQKAKFSKSITEGISQAGGVRTHGSGPSDAGASGGGGVSQASHGSSSSSNTHQQASRASGSTKKRSCDDEDQESRPPVKRRTIDPKGSEHTMKRFASPYWKHDPRQHGNCFKAELKLISRVKQHLARVHYREFYCERCLQVSKSKESHEAHLEQNCDYVSRDRLGTISHEQHRHLHRKSNKSSTESEKWFVVWDIVMPGKPRPSSPYMNPDLSQDLHEFQAYLRENLSIALRQELQADGIILQPEQPNEESLTEAASNRALSMLCDDWAARKAEEEQSYNGAMPVNYRVGGSPSRRPPPVASLPDSGVDVGSRAAVNVAQNAATLPMLLEEPDADIGDNSSGQAGAEAQVQSDFFELDLDNFDWDSFVQGLDSDYENAGNVN